MEGRVLQLCRQLQVIKLSQYKILKVLGSGAMGIVFLCEVEVGNPKKIIKVALKMITNYMGLSTSKLASVFQNEFYVLSEIGEYHKNIIQILTAFQDLPSQQMIEAADVSVRDLLGTVNRITGKFEPLRTQFFVFECQTCDLETKLIQLGANITFDSILKYSIELCEGLLFLYERHIIHRDIKLDNILLSESGDLIISDFGGSLKVDQNYNIIYNDVREGNMMHSAPEIHIQLFKAGNDAFKLINFVKQPSWELGCVLFNMAFGRFPFLGYPAGYGANGNTSVPTIDIPPDVAYPSKFTNIIKDLLANDPGARISLTDALTRLQNTGTDGITSLEPTSDEFKAVSKLFYKSWPRSSGITLASVLKIQNTQLASNFENFKKVKKITTSAKLWHGTSRLCSSHCEDPLCVQCTIATSGFDITKARSGTTSFRVYGPGIYFIPESSNAHNYNGKSEFAELPWYDEIERGNVGHRSLILCDVALGKTQTLGPKIWDINLRNYDSASYFTGMKEFVVFDNFQALPKYIVTYTCPRTLASNDYKITDCLDAHTKRLKKPKENNILRF